ncbi:MAG: hypothetical protein HC854_14650 [Flavobacterium sp.]|nr:hypothetical protein [Flavobacterium sp.]
MKNLNVNQMEILNGGINCFWTTVGFGLGVGLSFATGGLAIAGANLAGLSSGGMWDCINK